ncbi:sensor histidine kinase [Scleromatobacter humisilvae]|uniref:Histidine kinase n=1 Tax=Scleromatobacter humisilvae TaxID=2897159 RepID=A0A9X1YNR9_9BURK|nr:histidine kinase [Scleromatobacter humisilvae]MCK9689187.1 histidine kinase [Scleromatobacter humisilvae]
MIAGMSHEASIIPQRAMPTGIAWLRVMGLAGVITLAEFLGPTLACFVVGGTALKNQLAVLPTMVPQIFLGNALSFAVLVVGYRWIPRGGRGHAAGLLALVLVLTVAGMGRFFAMRIGNQDGASDGWTPAFALQFNLVFALLCTLAYDHMRRMRAATDAVHASVLQRVALERELAGAQLQLLQAQVEPHFLFNTLANLRRLVRTDPAAARAMLADLMRYLEVALPRLRDEHSTLDRELGLVQAYTAVHQVRMGARLRTEFDVPDELARRRVPPLVLLTLVENAIKHGVQPLAEGALVSVAARSDGRHLTLVVADTGRGMGSSCGGGTGLANLRARLGALHGAAASLSLEVNEPRGLIATIVLPEAVE